MQSQTMFAQPFADNGRKRLRDDDFESGQVCGFGEHRSKRLALPVRTSPSSQNRPAPFYSNTVPPTLTPTDSDEDQPKSQSTLWPTPPSQGFDRLSEHDDEMDMMDTVTSPVQNAQCQPGSKQFQNAPMGLTLNNSTGRIPTPMHPNFASQIRGHGGWNGLVNPANGQMSGTVNMGHVGTGYQDYSVPRTIQSADAWSSAISRRIPSPVSEVDMQNEMISPGMCIDNAENNMFSAQLSTRLAQSTLSPREDDTGMTDGFSSPVFRNVHPRQPANLDLGASADCVPATTESLSAPATPSPSRNRGHVRSRETVNNWAWQPGMKKSFSIGYRADCDKCRAKVPGHFNHIIITYNGRDIVVVDDSSPL